MSAAQLFADIGRALTGAPTVAKRAQEVEPGERVFFCRRPGYVVQDVEFTGSGVRHLYDEGAEHWANGELCLVSRPAPLDGGMTQ